MDAANIIESISIIVAAWAVIIGVTAWRREYVGKRKLELAEDVLALFYEARDAMDAIRSSFASAGEGSTRQAAPDESEEEKQALDAAFVTHERYNRNRELFGRLFSMRYRYMARFGKDPARPFDELRDVVVEVRAAADAVKHYWLVQTHGQNIHVDDARQFESIIWRSGRNDPITPRVDKLISDIEAQTRKILVPSVVDKLRQWFF